MTDNKTNNETNKEMAKVMDVPKKESSVEKAAETAASANSNIMIPDSLFLAILSLLDERLPIAEVKGMCVQIIRATTQKNERIAALYAGMGASETTPEGGKVDE